jgi:tetratricopeptide (TPR) repeat protein
LLDSYRHPPQARPLKADTAHGLLRLVYGEQHHFTLTDRQRVSAFARPALVAGAVGLGFGMQDPFRLVVEAAASDDAQVSRSHLPLLLQGSIQRAFSEGHTPPYLPLLAIRLARQAIRENPYDPSAYLALADAYLVLDATTIQGHLLADSNIYNRVRQTQRLAALEEVLLLDPKDWETHLLVAQIVERFSVDTALQHAESALEIMEKLPPHEAHPEVMETRIAGVEKYVERLRRAEEQSETQYVKSINKNAPLAFRARAAYEQYHLGEMALGLLADADQNPTTPEEKQTLSESINAEIAILLDLGRINHKDVVETVSDLNYSKDEANPWRQNPRFQYAMHAYRRCMAIGDYARAHGLLNQMELEQRVSNWREGTRVFINGLYARGPWPTLFLQDVATQRGSDSLRGNNGLGIIIPPPDKRPKGEDTKDLAAMEALTDPQFVVSLIVARLALAAPFTPGPLPWESLRLGELHVTLDDLPLRDKDGRITQVFRGLVRGFGNQYIIQADFSALRGMVALEQGNIELATKDLHKVFDYLYPEDERKTVLETGTSPMLDCHGRRVAMYWLRELENRKPR